MVTGDEEAASLSGPTNCVAENGHDIPFCSSIRRGTVSGNL